MNREEIKKIIPHREPMLLVDEAEVVSETTALGRYTVRGDEYFLQGHFPEMPVVPGVILCEMMAQTCSVLLGNRKTEGQIPFFTGLTDVKFRSPVKPGDTIEFECTIEKVKEPFFFAKGKGKVNGKLSVSGNFSFALVKEK